MSRILWANWGFTTYSFSSLESWFMVSLIGAHIHTWVPCSRCREIDCWGSNIEYKQKNIWKLQQQQHLFTLSDCKKHTHIYIYYYYRVYVFNRVGKLVFFLREIRLCTCQFGLNVWCKYAPLIIKSFLLISMSSFKITSLSNDFQL